MAVSVRQLRIGRRPARAEATDPAAAAQAPTDRWPVPTPQPIPLPTTSYGYTAPAGATAHGWRCADPHCGLAGRLRGDGRVLSCPRCGGPADVEFDQPWAHQAHGMWLAHQRHRAADPQVRAHRHAELQAWLAAGAPSPLRALPTQTGPTPNAPGAGTPVPAQRPTPGHG